MEMELGEVNLPIVSVEGIELAESPSPIQEPIVVRGFN